MNITHKQYFNVSNASFVQTVKTISRSTFLFIKLNSFIILCIFVRTVKPRYLYKNKSFNVTSVITSAISNAQIGKVKEEELQKVGKANPV